MKGLYIVVFAILACKDVSGTFMVNDESQTLFDQLIAGRYVDIGLKSNEHQDTIKFVGSNVDIELVKNLIFPAQPFSSMNKNHKIAYNEIKASLLAQDTFDQFLLLAEALRDYPGINKKAWLHAVLAARIDSKELRALKLKISLPELVPDHMFAREDLELARNRNLNDECVTSDETIGVDNGLENTLWYFRQDVFANAHHYFWHLHHAKNSTGDRRGELFYFMHHEFLARYTSERITNGMPELTPFEIYHGAPMIGYNSHITDAAASVNYTARLEGTPLVDVFVITVEEQLSYLHAILAAVEEDYMIHANGTLIPLQTFEGIDILGDSIESVEPINPGLYGPEPHNLLHFLISASMDPQLETGELGVMTATSMSMRDTIFYPYHQTINNIMLAHKERLEPYSPDGSDFPLRWDAVNLLRFEVYQENSESRLNILETHWAQQEFNLSYGLDWLTNKSVRICSKQLDYEPFEYRLLLNATEGDNFPATVRIFMAPRFDSSGERISMEEQHKLFFTMDTFTTNLNTGLNLIKRSSMDSRLTIPSNSWLENLNSTENYCGCGWPSHLLLPKGTPEGFTFDLFAMVTDGTEDLVLIGQETPGECSSAPIWCGILGERYPDSRPAGYPFDRIPYLNTEGIPVENIEEFTAGIQNMDAIQVKLWHNEDA